MPEATSSAPIPPEPQPDDLLTFVGSLDRLNEPEQFIWTKFLRGLGKWDGFVTGGRVGFDDFVGRTLVENFPTHRHIVYVPADRTQVAAWWRDPAKASFVQVREMLPGTTWENHIAALVDTGQALVAKPKAPVDMRSMTWEAMGLARAASKPIIIPQFHGAGTL